MILCCCCSPPPAAQVHFLVASCENMVDGAALRPGDILVASNGKTVEIISEREKGGLFFGAGLRSFQARCAVHIMP